MPAFLSSTRDPDGESESLGRVMSPVWMGLACGGMLAAGVAAAGATLIPLTAAPVATEAADEEGARSRTAHTPSPPREESQVSTVAAPPPAVAPPAAPALPRAVPTSPVKADVSPSTKWVKTFIVPASESKPVVTSAEASSSIATISASPAPLAGPPRQDEGPTTVASIGAGDDGSAAGAGEKPAPIAPASRPQTSQISLAVPSAVRIRGRDTFQIGSDVYKLTTLDGLGVARCDRRANPRCENHPRADLKKALAGATLSCEVAGEVQNVHRVTCSRPASAAAKPTKPEAKPASAAAKPTKPEAKPASADAEPRLQKPVRHRVRAARRSDPPPAAASATTSTAQAESVRVPSRTRKRNPLRTLF